jgi:peroxiredoxin
MLSCNNVDSTKLYTEQKKKPGTTNNVGHESNKVFTINAEDILKDFMTWYTYSYNNIRLAQDFIGLDTDSSILNKNAFLNRLATGNFVAFKIIIRDDLPIYKLYKLSKTNADIQNAIKQMASNEISHYKMEGKELPDYDFKDLNGNSYNKTTTKGKTLVIKCWFIHCVACVKEFPELNKLVDKYKDRDDILFISLAMDSKQDLISFLNKRHFNYAVVPDKEEYMSKRLGITEYPTHILVDKNEKIIKVVNTVSDLIPFIEKQIKKSRFK